MIIKAPPSRIGTETVVSLRAGEPIPVTDPSFSVAMLEALTDISNELKLMNMRIEEAFQTRINEGDI